MKKKIPKSMIVELVTNKKGETILPIPKEYVKYLKLKVNDEMDYTLKDGQLFLSKKNKPLKVVKIK